MKPPSRYSPQSSTKSIAASTAATGPRRRAARQTQSALTTYMAKKPNA